MVVGADNCARSQYYKRRGDCRQAFTASFRLHTNNCFRLPSPVPTRSADVDYITLSRCINNSWRLFPASVYTRSTGVDDITLSRRKLIPYKKRRLFSNIGSVFHCSSSEKVIVLLLWFQVYFCVLVIISANNACLLYTSRCV